LSSGSWEESERSEAWSAVHWVERIIRKIDNVFDSHDGGA